MNWPSRNQHRDRYGAAQEQHRDRYGAATPRHACRSLPLAVLKSRVVLAIIAAAGLLLAAAPFAPDLSRVLEALGLPYGDSDDFAVDTSLPAFTVHFAESRDFALDTYIDRSQPDYADSANFPLNVTGLNRVWGDSEPFTVDDTGVPPPEHVLQVLPSVVSAAQSAGAAVAVVLNLGTCAMNWTAAVTLGSPWLRITSGASGTNGGIIFLAYDANLNADLRSGILRVSAPGATPSYVDVTVTQSGTAPPPGAAVTHFTFSNIPSPQTVNVAFPITLTARDAVGNAVPTYQGRVDLSAQSAALIAPRFVQMVGGTWSGNVTLDQPGEGISLRASASNGLQGISNYFNLLANSGPTTGRIEGKVTIGNPPHPAEGVDVFLYTLPSGLLVSPLFTTPADGRYAYSSLPGGDYEIKALINVNASPKYRVRVSAGATVTQNLHVSSPQQRVLLVGGMMGSTSAFWDADRYPMLFGIPGDTGQPLVLYDPVCRGGIPVDIWETLHRTLNDHFDLRNVPWDWRLPVEEAWRKYLLPAINDAKRSETDKVSIVAHSMGGLLVRAYIQSDEYRGDVDKFAMCGTPNRGAVMSYYVWQGGDTIEADIQAGDGFLELLCGLGTFYTQVRNNLYFGIHGDYPPLSRFSNSDWRLFFQRSVRGVGDLMPTFRFLHETDGYVHFSSDYQDSILWQFESGASPYSHKERFVPWDGPSDKIRTKLFVSGSEPTLYEVPVKGPGSNGLYPDGVPDGQPLEITFGDGTVLKNSAQVGVGTISVDASRPGSHAELMRVYSDRICGFLMGTTCSNTADDLLVQATQAVLSISLLGRVQPYMIDPSGKNAAGISPITLDVEKSIPGSTVNVAAGSAEITLTDPVDGEYQMQITGVPGEVFAVEVSYIDETNVEQISFRGIHHDSVITFGIVVDVAGTPALVIVPPFQSTTNLRSQRISDLTQLVWSASPDPNAASYNVYARPDDQPKFTLLGSTNGTTFDTAHPWNVGGSAASWQYFVVAAAADGTESFFTETVENRNPLIARLSADPRAGVEPLPVAFADASSGEVSAWAWDFDSDGAIDSTVQNPAHTYPYAGSYTVTLTVGGPEGTDTAIRVGYVTVDPIVPPPPPVPGDFDADGDVDLLDYKAFKDRMNGPFVDPSVAGWHLFDLDPDYDVDLRDFAEFQTRFNPLSP